MSQTYNEVQSQIESSNSVSELQALVQQLEQALVAAGGVGI